MKAGAFVTPPRLTSTRPGITRIFGSFSPMFFEITTFTVIHVVLSVVAS